jgi:hypothetical protein
MTGLGELGGERSGDEELSKSQGLFSSFDRVHGPKGTPPEWSDQDSTCPLGMHVARTPGFEESHDDDGDLMIFKPDAWLAFGACKPAAAFSHRTLFCHEGRMGRLMYDGPMQVEASMRRRRRPSFPREEEDWSGLAVG